MNRDLVGSLRKAAVVGAVLSVLSVIAVPVFAEPQPHMQAALDALQAAEKQLSVAAKDHGGHRARALKQVRSAIGEVRKGIAFDNKTPPNKKR